MNKQNNRQQILSAIAEAYDHAKRKHPFFAHSNLVPATDGKWPDTSRVAINGETVAEHVG